MMDQKQKELEQQKTERQIDASAARLKMIEARAKRRKAEGAIAEISGLQALGDRVRQQFREWKDADEASFEALRNEVQRGTDALSRGTDAASDRFDRLDDATDRWFDAETDQVGAAFQMFYAWLGEAWVDDKQAAAQAQKDLRAAWDDVSDKRRALSEAVSDKKDEARGELQNSLARVKAKLQEVAARLRQKKGGKATERRT
jgi:hypothetical protein